MGGHGYRATKRLAIVKRRKKVAGLYLGKLNQYEIAAQLGVSQGLIHKDLRIIENQWQAETKHEIEVKRARALASLDNLERIAWEKKDYNLVLKIFDQRNRITGIYSAVKVVGKLLGGLTVMGAIKAALMYRDNGRDLE